mmetsp:Transcript_58835/g.170692  ORF Transcript_58835/g.170692 Transcript_58835/m.170692 type:complete len:342 (-) Transcript_58835:33-1058(-)
MVGGFPALVPGLIGSGLALTAVAACYVLMPELPLVPIKAMPSKIRTCAVEAEAEDPEAQTPKLAPGVGRAGPHAASWPPALIVMLLLRFTQGVCIFSLYEAAPLWMISSKALGGLALTEAKIGSLLSRSSIWHVCFFVFVLPRATAALGLRRFAALQGVIAVATNAALPFTSSFVMANAMQMLAASTTVAEASCNLAMTNNLVPDERRAVVNGVATTVETLGKALGPAATSYFFALTLNTWGRAGHAIVFLFLALLHIGYTIGVSCLPRSAESSPAHGVAAVPSDDPDLIKASPFAAAAVEKPVESPQVLAAAAAKTAECEHDAAAEVVRLTASPAGESDQ